MECFQERAFYYWRHGLYGHVDEICRIGLESKPSNLFLIMYRALAKGINRDTEGALELLTKMAQRRDLILLYCVAIYCIKSRQINRDEAFLKKSKERIKKHSNNSNPLSVYYSAMVAWFFNETEIMNDLLKLSKESETVTQSMIILNAWISLSKRHIKYAMSLFSKVLEDRARSFDILALYGKAICYSCMKEYSESVQVYARILSKYDFPELHLEKCRIYILMERWDFSISLASEIKEKIFSPLEANLIVAVNSLLKSSSEQYVSNILDDLVDDIEKYESCNWYFQMKVAFSLGTICNQNLSIIDRLLRFAGISAEASNKNLVCCSVLGYIQLLAHNYVAALSTVPDTMIGNQLNSIGIEFQIRLLIDTGRYSEAQDMLDLYGIINCPGLILTTLQAKINRKTIYSNESNIKPLLISLEEHLKQFTNDELPFQNENPFELRYEQYIEFFIRFRADVIIDALDELITYNYSGSYGPTKEIGNQLINILAPVAKATPNYAPFNYFMAILYQLNKKIDDSLFLFEKVLVTPSVFRLSHCLFHTAEIFYQKGQVEFAATCIEEASVDDPTLIQDLNFVILKAQVTSTVKENLQYMANLIDTSHQPLINYINFIDLCLSVNDYVMAENYIRNASLHITHPSDKALLILRQAVVLASKGNYEKAFSSLEALKKHQRYAAKAVEAQAEIYYKFLHDSSKYVATYHEYTKNNPVPSSYMMLGRSLKRLTQFNEAIDAFKQGIDNHSPDEALLKELIMTYVSANRFDEAVKHFTGHAQMMRSSSLFSLDFIKLMIHMKRYEEASQCITRVMQILNHANKLAHSGILYLHGLVEEHSKNYLVSNTHFLNSISLYEAIIKDNTENSFIKRIKEIMSTITYEIGQNYIKLQEREKAIESFYKALEYNQLNRTAVVALFDMFKGRYDTEKCRKVCMDYLEIDPQNETIALLLTSTQTTDLHEAIPYLTHVLDQHPTYFRTLVRLCEICARNGRLNTAINYMKKAKALGGNQPGFYYVQGLHSSYVGNPQKAMKFFRLAMNSNKWDVPAKVSLFSILTNPERKYLWFEEEPLTTKENLQEAENLLSTIRTSSILLNLLQCDLYCSQNTESSINNAIEVYNGIIKENPGNIAASVGIARCYTRIGEYDKASGLLKFVLSGKPFHENVFYFEEAYLMRAFIVEKETNFSSAQHYIYLALELNMCCKRGWEMSAKVHLSRKMYQEASVAFGYCWELCDHSDPEVGYNYAYCCLKAKKYDVALIICREVMNLYPEYKDLREKVLEPAFKLIKR